MTLPIPTLAVAESGGGYLWQLEVTETGMEMDRSRSTGADIATLPAPDWHEFERRIMDLADHDPYRLVDETLASIFEGLQVPESVVDKFSASLFDWICDNRAALARLQ